MLILDVYKALAWRASASAMMTMGGLLTMRNAGQPWAVSSLARAAGLAALSEDAYVSKPAPLSGPSGRLISGWSGQSGAGGEANYIFFRCDVPDLTKSCGARHSHP